MKNSSSKISLNFSKQLFLREPILAQNFIVNYGGKENQQNNSLVQFFDQQLHIQFKSFHTIIPLDFNLQFQIIYAQKKSKYGICKEIPIGFLLFYHNDVIKMTRYFQGDQIATWRKQLIKKITQRGFSKDYKLCKKIKQRSHWMYSIVQHIQTHKKFMCKGMKKNNAQGLKQKQQLQKQLKIWRKLNHYNLLKFHQVRETQHSIYVIFEMVEEKCLAKKISETPFNMEEIQLIVKGILQGLVLLHSKGIIHRNISPESIFFRKNRELQCLIGNFKDCCQIEDDEQTCFQLHGTTGYIAPEIFPEDQTKKYQYSFASDIFSVGAILYQLLLGKPLFHGLSKQEKMMQNVSGLMNIKLSDFLLPKNNLNFNAKKQGYSLTCKLLSQDPNERFSALEALNHPFLNIENSTNQKKNKRCSENLEITKEKMLQSRRLLNRISEQVPKPNMKVVESCQLIESDQEKIDLDHKMLFYQLARIPKFLQN